MNDIKNEWRRKAKVPRRAHQDKNPCARAVNKRRLERDKQDT